jgi:hypothetical protein
LQLKPQLPLTQVGVLFAGCGQGVQELPQLFTLLFETHWPLHRW